MAHAEKCKACGNWFNAAVYKTCPYCGQEIIGEAEVKQTEKREEPIKGVKKAQKNKKHNWWRSDSLETEVRTTAKKRGNEEAIGEPIEEKREMNVISEEEAEPVIEKVPGTVPLHAIDQKDERIEYTKPLFQPEEVDLPDYEETEDKAEESNTSPLVQNIERAGRTVGKWIEREDGANIQPVVGWLVGVKGAYYGQDFKLKNGRNSISRSEDADIKLINDESVSRKTMATIIYDSKGKVFSIVPGDSDSLCYVNQNALYERMELQGYEEIEFGDSELNMYIFVPFCGKQFQWPRAKAEGVDTI